MTDTRYKLCSGDREGMSGDTLDGSPVPCDHDNCPECMAVFQRDTDRINHLHGALIRIRDHHVKTGPYNQDGSTCTRCLLCGADIDKGERHVDQRVSCAQAESALASIPHRMGHADPSASEASKALPESPPGERP